MKAKIRWVFLLICVVLFCLSAYKISTQLLTEHKEDNAFAELLKQVEADRSAEGEASPVLRAQKTLAPSEAPAMERPETVSPDDTEDASEAEATDEAEAVDSPAPEATAEPSVTDAPPGDEADDAQRVEEEAERVMLPDYTSLYEMNPDVFGWIEIKDTKINYPVMYTPEKPEKYLHLAFDGSNAFSGVPFVDGSCPEDGGHYIIYGHHMKNGTMFADMVSYAEEDFWQAHPTIRFDTLYEKGTYDIVAAFYSRVYSAKEEGVFRYYAYADLRDPERFEEYMREVRAAALYDTGVEVVYGDQLITLSTCEYSTKDGRFVVVARKRLEQEETGE